MNSRYDNVFIYQWNANSLRNKSADFRKLLAQHNFPVLCIQEAGVRDDFRLSNYVIYKSSRRAGNSRAMLCVRKDLPSYLIQSSDSDIPEFVACKISFRNRSVIVISLYLQASSKISLDSLVNVFDIADASVLVCGDFNAHNVIWGSEHTDSRGHVVECAAEKCNLTVLNDSSPTFLRGYRYSSCIDVTLCLHDLLEGSEWSTDIETHGSDHFPILVKHRFMRSTRTQRYSKYTNWQHFRHRITGALGENPNLATFTTILCDSYKISTKQVIVPSEYAGVDGEYERLRAIRRRAERAYRRSGKLEDYKTAQKTHSTSHRRLQKLGRRRWREYCSSLSPFTPVPRIWAVVRSFSGPVTQSNPFRALAIALNTPQADVADEFCRLITRPGITITCPQFTSSKALANQKVRACFMSQHPQLDCEFSLDELKSALELCRTKTAAGPDGVTYMMLKNLGPAGRMALLELFNDTWISETLPDSWKLGRVIPVLKPGKTPLCLESFRPVCLTSCLCKLMEIMVNSRLQWWCEHTKVLSDYMTGFRQRRCTMDAVLDIVTSVEHERMCGNVTIAVFLDIQRAFDSVSHIHVLAGMLELGLCGRSLRWISNFLSERKIYMVTIEGQSNYHSVTHGVPQGSVLSPLLFNCVMAALPGKLPTGLRYSLYADDICIWASGSDIREVQTVLQQGLNIIDNFLKERGMSLSYAKTAVLPFTRRQMNNFHLTLEGQTLKLVKEHKFLGVILDRHLSWASHIRALEKQVNIVVNVLRRLAGTAWGDQSLHYCKCITH